MTVSPAAPASPPSPDDPQDTAPATPDARARRSRNTVLAGLVALILLGAGWELVLAPTGSGTLAIKVLPLLPAVPGVLRYRLYTFRWLSLLIWVYAGEGLLRATSGSGPSVGLAWAELALSMLVFAGCVAHVRARLGPRRQAAPGTAS